MKTRLLSGVLLSVAVAACGPRRSNFVRVDDVALGRVVIYRNGVAYYERRATVDGGVLTVSVPRERVDDFLKSLTVVDAISRQPLPVSIPRQQDEGAFLVMKLQLPVKQARAEVVLTYVTESPAWKPSYRVVVGEKGKVLLESWAIVDNTSGEDWKNVKIGVGSSSALAFRYDLWSVRDIKRTTLSDTEQFAIAPPTGISPYGREEATGGEAAIAELSDEEIRRPAGHPENRKASRAVATADKKPAEAAESDNPGEVIVVTGSAPVITKSNTSSGATVVDGYTQNIPTGRTYGAALAESPSPRSRRKAVAAKPAPPKEPPRPQLDARVASGDQKMRDAAKALLASGKNIVVEGYGDPATSSDASRRALDRANIVRNQLIDAGVPPARINVTTKLEANRGERVRLVAKAPAPEDPRAPGQPPRVDLSAPPVGESHFASQTPMTVEKGASAMVSMMRLETDGEVVYLYDAESERGNADFAFRAVRFMNPTTSTLENGPVTVYGNERFIGEGLTESVPPRASAVVPYALDRQIVVERAVSDENQISKLVALSRGVLTAQVQHIRKRRLTITNRLREPAQVFVRHTTNKGWTLLPGSPASFERIGDAHLFKLELKPHEVRAITIAEATPMDVTLDLSADLTLDMMRVYVQAPDGSKEVKDQLKKLLAIHKELVDAAQMKDSLRSRLGEYKQREVELQGQLITLQAVKTANDLMSQLRAKMNDISNRVHSTTVMIVREEDKIMLARVKFQDALAELTLPDVTAAAATPKK